MPPSLVLVLALGVVPFGASIAFAQGAPPAMQDAGRPQPLPGLARTHAPQPTTAAITAADLMTRDYIIADDSMEGRDTGGPGGVKSTNYIAAEMRRLGLEPAGDNGTFFQTVPFVMRHLDSTSALAVGEGRFTLLRDFLILPRLGLQVFLGGLPYGGAFRGDAVPTVYGGRIGDPAMLDPALARGKVVIFDLPERSPFPPAPWQFWRTGEDLARYRGARALVVDLGGTPLPPTRFLRDYASLFYADTAAVALPVIMATPGLAQAVFGAAERAVGMEGQAMSGHFGFVDAPTAAPVRNVVAVLRGSDPVLREEYVAIGAHADHVGVAPAPVDHDSLRIFNSIVRPRGADDPPPRTVSAAQYAEINAALAALRRTRPPRPDSIFNGADDDGSGTVLAMEIAEAFARAPARPKRSLLFVWHAAEERGLYGAQYFTDHPTVPRGAIVAQINMDQMGRGGPEDAPPGGPDALVVLGLRRISQDLGPIAEAVNARPGYGFAFDTTFDAPGDPSNGWCRSDHYMYARYDIPVLFFVSAVWYIDYHMVSDEPQYLNYPRMAKIGNYIRDVTGEVANMPNRPRVANPARDPDRVCRQ